MCRLLLKSSYLSSILFFAFACSPVRGLQVKETKRVSEKEVLPVVRKEASVLYRAEIKAYGRLFSGIIVLKQTATDTSHLTFITQLGMKMFDYEIVKDSFRLAYVFKPLDKPKILKLLYNDFSHMLQFPLYHYNSDHFIKEEKDIYRVKQKTRLYYTCQDNRTRRIVNRGKLFTRETQSFMYDENGVANNIKVRHKGFLPLKMNLQRINKLE